MNVKQVLTESFPPSQTFMSVMFPQTLLDNVLSYLFYILNDTLEIRL